MADLFGANWRCSMVLEVVVVSWFCVGDLIPNLVPSLDTVEVVVLEVQCCLGR